MEGEIVAYRQYCIKFRNSIRLIIVAHSQFNKMKGKIKGKAIRIATIAYLGFLVGRKSAGILHSGCQQGCASIYSNYLATDHACFG